MPQTTVTLVVERTQTAHITATYDPEEYDQWRGSFLPTPQNLQAFLESSRTAGEDLETWAAGSPESSWRTTHLEIDRVAPLPEPQEP